MAFELEFLHLQLHDWVLHLLLCLHLRSLGLVLHQHLLRRLSHHARQRNLNLWWQLLVFGRQRHTQLLLDLLAHLVTNVLCNVRSDCAHDLGSLWVLTNELLNHRVLHQHHVHLDMRLMVLM